MVDKKEPSAIVLPFGKHKGSTVAEVLASDPQYAEWLLGQNWLAERFAELHAAIQTRGAVSDDSPEHNLIQARFLEPLFRAAFVLASQPSGYPERAKIRQLARYAQWKEDPTGMRFYSEVRFEQRGIDVVVRAGFTTDPSRWWDDATAFNHTIEIKPSLGDDFPTVMRQMARLHCGILLIDRFAAVVPVETVRQMFAANHHKLITVREIEAEIANARALLAHG